MISRWLRILLWVVAFGLVLNLWLGGDHEPEEFELEIDDAAVVEYRVDLQKSENLEPEGKILYYDMILEEEADREGLKESVKAFTVDIVEEEERGAFNSLTVDIFDDELYRERTGPTLGRAVFAPEGNVDFADTISPGSYQDMEFSWDLLNKDWEQRPSDLQKEIWADWQDMEEEQEEMTENEIDMLVADEYDISPEEVADIREDVLRWQLMDVRD